MFFSLLSLSQGSGGGGESIFSFQGIEEGGGDFKGEKGWKRRGLRFHITDQFSDSNES